MRKFQAMHLIYICEYLAEARTRKETNPTNPLASALVAYGQQEAKATTPLKDSLMAKALDLLLSECEMINLHFSGKEVRRIFNLMVDHNIEPSTEDLKGVSQRVQDELEGCTLLQMPSAKAAYYNKEHLFGAKVSDKFGDIAKRHIKEAGNCYALGNDEACVYHLMVAMEQAVQKFGQKLGIKTGKQDKHGRYKDLVWDNILNETKPKIEAMSRRTKDQKLRFEKYSAIHSYLYGVKDAWRNPTMHPRPEGYNELEALNILNHVKSFMIELSSIF